MNCVQVFPVLPIKCFVVRFHLYSLWVSLAVCLQSDGNSDQCAAVHYVHVSNTANTFWMFWMRKTLRHVRAKFLLTTTGFQLRWKRQPRNRKLLKTKFLFITTWPATPPNRPRPTASTTSWRGV